MKKNFLVYKFMKINLASTGNSALLPFDVIDFDFGEKQFHC